MIEKMIDNNQDSNSSAQYPNNLVPANKKAPPLEGGHSMKIGGRRTLKYEISSPKFNELLIKT